jgi:hypothetical protein
VSFYGGTHLGGFNPLGQTLTSQRGAHFQSP